MSLVAYQSSTDESGDEDEQESQGSSSIAKTPLNSVASVPQKSREPVKIAIPSLREFDASEESEEPSKKPKIKASSGLLSLLPAPKHASKSSSFMPNSVKKKITDNKKLPIGVSTPDSFAITKKNIDETLSRKTLIQELGNKQVKQKNEMKRESDEDALSSDFFSLTSESSESTMKASKMNIPSVDFFSLTSQESTSNASKNDSLHKDFFALTNKSTPAVFNDCDKELSSFEDHIPKNSNQHHHRQDCGSSNTSEAVNPINCPNSDYQLKRKANAEYVFPHSSSSSYMAHDGNCSSSASNEGQFTEATSEEGGNEQTSSDIINDERFLRLQGKRRREFEDIDIIDVNVDSQLADRTQWLTKSITEEKKVSFSRKKGELPTQQQRRKHQITYLAFQAKERELDLKNQWAQNRLTKRETQSKYGF